MNWDAVGAMAELLGAIGVIVTLLYLTTQLRQNTRALRSSTMQTYRDETIALNDFSASYAEILVKAGRGEELTETESHIVAIFAQRLFGMMEAVYLGYKDGSIAKEVFDGRMKGFKLAMSRNRILSDYWPHWRQFDLTDSFVAYVDKEIMGADA